MNSKLFVIAGAISMIAFAIAVAAVGEWRAPARAAAKKNPVPADAASIARGKAVYASQCASYHGNSGRGEGPAAKSLEKSPGDLTKLRGQSDGELFWKITEGKKPMASYAAALSEQQRWDVVNYLRILGK
jgi:mono/diheme cytochrome c family protein